MLGTACGRSPRRGIVWAAALALCGGLPGGFLPPAQPAGTTNSPPPGGPWVAAISIDGTLKATAGPEQAVRIWRTSDGALLRTLTTKRPVASLAFSPDGRLLATGSPKNLADAVKLWRVSDGKCVQTYRYTNSVGFLAFSADGRRLIVNDSGRNRRLRVPCVRER